MAVNAIDSLGGPLSIEMVIDDSTLQASSNRIINQFDEIAKGAVEAGSKQQAVADQIAANYLKSNETIQAIAANIKNLQQQDIELKKQFSTATDPAAIAQYNTALEQLNKNMDVQVAELYKAVMEEVAKAGVEAGDSIASGVDVAKEKSVTALQELRKLKNELISGGTENPAFDSLLKDATELENRIKNVNRNLELTSSNTAGLEALKQGVGGVVGAFEALSGIMSFISTDNEEVRKSTEHVIAAMGVLNGIEEVGKVLSKESALNTYLLAQYRKLSAVATTEETVATTALAGAREAEAVATEAATVATVELDAAMDANPAGVLLLALTAIIVAVQAFGSATSDAAEDQQKMNEQIAQANDLLKSLVDLQSTIVHQRTTDAERAVSLAQAQGKSESEITALKLKALDAIRQENIYKAASFGVSRQDLELQKIELGNLLEQEQSMLRLVKVDDDRLKLLQARIELLKKSTETAEGFFKAEDDSEAKKTELKAAAAKKAADDALKSDAALADARLILVKKNSQAELDAKIDSINKAKAVELNNPDITPGETAKIKAQAIKDIQDAKSAFATLILKNEKDLIAAQLNAARSGSAEELRLRFELIDKNQQIELSQLNLTEAQKTKILSDGQKARQDLVDKFNNQNAEAGVNVEISNINRRLAAVQSGTEQELQLKKDLIEKQADLDTIKAGESIKNEQLLSAKVLEIYAKELADKKKLDDDFEDKRVRAALKSIDNETALKNSALDYATSNGSTKQRFDAQRQQLDNEFSGELKKLNEVQSALLTAKGDVNFLTAQANTIALQIAKIDVSIKILQKDLKKELLNDFAAGLSSIGGALSSLSSGLKSTNADLADIISTAGQFLNVTSQIAKSGLSFASGDILGGVSSAIGAVTSIFQLLSADREKRLAQEKEVKDFQDNIFAGEFSVNQLYRERERSQVKINQLRIEGIQKETDLLKAQSIQIQSDYQKVFDQLQKESFQQIVRVSQPFSTPRDELQNVALLGKTFEQIQDLYLKGQLTDAAAKLFQTLEKLKSEGADVDAALRQAAVDAKEAFTGTTAEGITDSIIEGLKNGKLAASDFADDFEDLMRGAILNSLKYQALEKPLNDFYDSFADAAQSGGSLTEEEIDKLRENYNSIITEAGKKFEDLKKITDVSFSGDSSNSLQGAFKAQLTEQTGSILAGQFSGLRIDVRSQLDVATRQLNHLARIEENTGALAEIREDIKSLRVNGIKIKP